MAKIRVAQIKDLSLTVPTTDNGFATLEVGTTTKDVLTSIAQGTPAQDATQSGIMTGITVAGNTITPVYNNLADLNLYTQTEVNNKITDAINALDTTADVTIASETAGIVTLKAGIAQVDGKIQQGTGFDITLAKLATTGKAEDVAIVDAGNLIEATTVEGALAELAGDIATLDAAQLSAGNGINITDKKINSDFVVTIETLEASEGVDAGTYIVIKGAGENGTEITKVNANAFVKDGFLKSVVLDEENGNLVFTWNTDAEAGEENQVTKIAISELCDVYTAKENDWIQLDGFVFSHKVVHAANISVGSKETDLVFSVPSITVDKAGHVTTAEKYNVSIPTATKITADTGTGLATEGAVKSYVDGQVGAVKVPSHVTEKIVATTDDQTTLNLQNAPYKNQAVVYQNGLCVIGEYTVDGQTITLNLEVDAKTGDVFTVDYEYVA